MLEQVGQAPLQRLQIFRAQIRLGHAAVVLQGLDCSHDHHGVGGHTCSPALDVKELFRTQIRAEARLGDHVVRQLEGSVGGGDGVAAVGNIGEGAAVDEGRSILQCLHQVGLDGVLQEGGHGALGLQIGGGDRLVVVGVAHNDAGQPLLQVLQAGGETQHRHDLAGHGDVEPVLPGHALHPAAQTVHDVPELAVVHVHAAPPRDLLHVDAEGVALLNVVIQHGGQQVVGRADGVKIAGKVQVDVLHGHHLRVAAAGGSALDAEHRAEGRLTQAEEHIPVQTAQGVGQTDAGGGLALPRRSGVDGGDEDQLALPGCFPQRGDVDLGLIAAIVFQQALVNARLRGHLTNGEHIRALSDLDVSFHDFFSFLRRK